MPVELLIQKLFRKKRSSKPKNPTPVFSKSGNIAKPDIIIYSSCKYVDFPDILQILEKG